MRDLAKSVPFFANLKKLGLRHDLIGNRGRDERGRVLAGIRCRASSVDSLEWNFALVVCDMRANGILLDKC